MIDFDGYDSVLREDQCELQPCFEHTAVLKLASTWS
jgi:hypothetical protein